MSCSLFSSGDIWGIWGSFLTGAADGGEVDEACPTERVSHGHDQGPVPREEGRERSTTVVPRAKDEARSSRDGKDSPHCCASSY